MENIAKEQMGSEYVSLGEQEKQKTDTVVIDNGSKHGRTIGSDDGETDANSCDLVAVAVSNADSEKAKSATNKMPWPVLSNDLKALFAGGYHVAIPTLLMFAFCVCLMKKTDATADDSNHTLSFNSSDQNFNVSSGNSNLTIWLSVSSTVSTHFTFWTFLKVLGSFIYTANGIINLKCLATGVKKDLLTPHMAYINSYMCWSAVIFGPLQILTDLIIPAMGYEFTLKFDYWYTLPNFAWAVEWGWQLLDKSKEAAKNGAKISPRSAPSATRMSAYHLGIRGLAIMIASIASIAIDCRYLGGIVFPAVGVQCDAGSRHPGYDVAFAAQAIAAIVMAVYCLIRHRSPKALAAFVMFFVGFVGFVVLQDLHHHLSPALTEQHWFESIKEIGIKVCDNTQINFSIWFFVFMFQHKHKRYQGSSKS